MYKNFKLGGNQSPNFQVFVLVFINQVNFLCYNFQIRESSIVALFVFMTNIMVI